jgi:cytochrome c oxidase subunit 2
MLPHFSIFPPDASTHAGQVDWLYGYLVALSIVMTVLIFVVVFFFAVKYRRRHPNEIPPYIHGSWKLETLWSVVPFLFMLVMFGWGAKLYFDIYTTHPDALDVYVVAKQWMWKVQYPEGQREINELHVPVGRPIKLTMASEDVIHSFFVPAFRIKRDVVPGHFNTVSFTATTPGRYHLFCAEYCGTQHSGMIGWVTVMSPVDYENWLSGGGVTGSMASQGEKMFQQLGCSTCHLLDEQGRCPNLRNVYGHPVALADGRTVLADDAYVRESVLNPNAKVVAGFKPDIMPTFQGQISEEGLMQLIAYIKSLAIKPSGPPVGAPATGQTAGAARFGGTGTPENPHPGVSGSGPVGATPITERPQSPRTAPRRQP